MRFKIFTIGILLILSACGSEKASNEIEFFNHLVFNLKTGEEMATIDKESTALFFEILGERPYQTPLFRKIHSGDGKIFLALPIGVDSLIKDCDNGIRGKENQLNDWGICSKEYGINNFYATEILLQKDGNTILILAIHPDPQQRSSYFSADSLISRFTTS